MNPGDIITYRTHYRVRGIVGGWKADNERGKVVKINSKTVVVHRVYNDGRLSSHARAIRLDRVLA